VKPRQTFPARLNLSGSTKGADTVSLRHLTVLLPVTRRRKTDKLLTRRELGVIATVRDMLTKRLEIAAYDAMLHDVILNVEET
jgi:hypothetical protein